MYAQYWCRELRDTPKDHIPKTQVKVIVTELADSFLPHFCIARLPAKPDNMADINDPVLAKPADLCCLKGDFHKGEPTGKTIQIEGVDTYVATPDSKVANGNVLLFFPDAFGLHINSMLMMDAYAACGYLTPGVDYFLGVSTFQRKLHEQLSDC